MINENNAIVAHTRAAFAADGPVAQALPGYEVNELQIDFATRAADASGAPDPAREEGGEITLLEAGTGIGKSLGYMVPLAINAALTGERAMISTASKQLQEQLITVDGRIAVAVAKAITGREVAIARRIGRRNYIDYDRVVDVLADLRDEGSAEAVVQLEGWLDAHPATFMEAEEDHGLTLPGSVTPEDICVTAASGMEAQAAYRDHVEEADDADLVIINHALALIDAQAWGRAITAKGVARPVRLAVFDEADTLPSIARGLAEAKTPLSTVSSLLEALPDGDAKDQAVAALATVDAEVKALVVEEPVIVESGRHGDLAAAVEELIEALDEAIKATDDDELIEDMRWLRADLSSWMRAAAGHNYRVAVATASPSRRRPALVTVATQPARVLGRLWRRGRNDQEPFLRSVVFTSATLSTPGATTSFGDFLRALGAAPGWANYASARSTTLEPPSFGSMSFVLASRKVSAPFRDTEDGEGVELDPAWLDYVRVGVREAMSRGGRVLVLAASYADAQAIGERVEDALVHRKGLSLAPLLEAYRATDGAVLVTPTAWTGVSLPGLVDHLVIPRVPFGAPDQARDEVMLRALTARGRSEEEARWIIRAEAQREAKRRLRQGIGRGIRTASDRCCLWILDPRFPLPEKIVRDRRRRLGQGLAKGRGSLVMCIPKRFRVGVRPAFDCAEIFSTGDGVTEAA